MHKLTTASLLLLAATMALCLVEQVHRMRATPVELWPVESPMDDSTSCNEYVPAGVPL